MKYLIFFSFLLLWGCGDAAERVDANGSAPSEKIEKKKLKIINQDRPNKRLITTDNNLVKSKNDNAKLMKGTFMYYADAATFKECGTGTSFAVSGNAYTVLERDYLKLRTKDFQEIYVELKAEIKTLPGMEDGTKKATLIAKELVKIDPERSCN